MIIPARTSKTMLNNSGKNGNPCHCFYILKIVIHQYYRLIIGLMGCPKELKDYLQINSRARWPGLGSKNASGLQVDYIMSAGVVFLLLDCMRLSCHCICGHH